jgi:hypothetical protein
MLLGPVANTSLAHGHPLEVRHYGRADGYCELYEDDGTTFAFETGAYRIRNLRFQGGKGSESIGKEGPALFGSVERWVQMGGQAAYGEPASI